MLMTRASRLAIEALVELADMGSQKWVTSEALSERTTGDLPFITYADFVSPLGAPGGPPPSLSVGLPSSVWRKMRVVRYAKSMDGSAVSACRTASHTASALSLRERASQM